MFFVVSVSPLSYSPCEPTFIVITGFATLRFKGL